MKLREQALLKVEPQVFVPTSSRPAVQRFAWKTNIVTTVFWIAKQAGGNNPVPNFRSSWDFKLAIELRRIRYSEKSERRNFIPVSFVPHQNPFYCALPYNDVTHGQFKTGSAVGDSVVQAILHGTGTIGLLASLDRNSQRQSHLLRTMGRFAPISHRSLSICVWKRKTETEPQPRRRTRCFTRGARLPRAAPTDVTDCNS